MAGTTFNSFVAGETTSALKMNQNFEWLQGDRVPMNSGAKENNLHDLGSATFSWKNLYVGTDLTIAGKTLRDPFAGAALTLSSAVLKVETEKITASMINDGTLSTPDFRAESISQIAESGSGSIATGTQISTVSISTNGGKVLVIGSATLRGQANNRIDAEVSVDRNGTALTGGRQYQKYQSNSPAAAVLDIPFSVQCIDEPPTGTATYVIRYNSYGIASTTVSEYSLVATEFKK